MKFFTTFTPAENLIVRDQRRVSHKQMLELTFMDLLLKKVLKLEYAKDETTNINDTSTEAKVAYVSIGENYRTYSPVRHEQIFMKPFVTIVSTRILFSSLVKVLYEHAESPRKFRALVASSERVSKYFRSPWFFHTIGYQPLNKEGSQAQEQIFSEQTLLSGTFHELWNKERPKAMALINQINGNAFLLPLSMQMIKTLGFELDAHTSPVRKADYSANGGCGGFYYSDYDHVSGGFGEHEPSSGDSWDGDSGCGGDSGCSGCGGCGGGD